MATCQPFWMVVVIRFGTAMLWNITVLKMPAYFHNVIGLKIDLTGYYMSALLGVTSLR